MIPLHPPNRHAFAFASFFCLASFSLPANELLDPRASDRVENLRGAWRFSIGDDERWAQPDFDDSAWTKVRVPNEWEDSGYRDYNGYAWYRKSFNLSSTGREKQLFVSLGQIDDVDEVFLNGIKIGTTGQFPPDYQSAWSHERAYLIPAHALQDRGENMIAVRVYDGGGVGGMRHGRLGIYETEMPSLWISLAGKWQFRTGDDVAWAKQEADETGFSTLSVPGYWDDQGHAHYDGFAWYRTRFEAPEVEGNKTMVLLLGKVDDLDEVYLNGERIGGTGNLDTPHDNHGVAYYNQVRGYYFPARLLQDRNLLAVRVFDQHAEGGIYSGPIGILTQEDYIQFWESRRRNRDFLDDLRDAFE